MRFAATAAAVVVTMVAIGGCAAEKQRVERDDKISAARLSGKFRADDPIVKMLSDDERGALSRAGMMEPMPEGEELASEDGESGDPLTENKSGFDKAGDAMMSVLTVGVTLGMMAAPYLLF